eukprot:scaffold3018_cov83-Cylindrotheca_fusiformis.AAC.1
MITNPSRKTKSNSLLPVFAPETMTTILSYDKRSRSRRVSGVKVEQAVKVGPVVLPRLDQVLAMEPEL